MEFAPDENEFYRAYGQAMNYWGQLEGTLGTIFYRVVGTEEAVAMAVYYSARSFLGRADMLSSVVDHAKTTPDGKAFIRGALKLARGYAEARNAMAHDQHVLRPGTAGVRGPAGMFIGDPIDKQTIDYAQIVAASDNFLHLIFALKFSLGRNRLLLDPSLSLALLSQLATDPRTSVGERKPLNDLLSEIQRVDG